MITVFIAGLIGTLVRVAWKALNQPTTKNSAQRVAQRRELKSTFLFGSQENADAMANLRDAARDNSIKRAAKKEIKREAKRTKIEAAKQDILKSQSE
jgi:hypothetical protein